jgi:uncharacterized protein
MPEEATEPVVKGDQETASLVGATDAAGAVQLLPPPLPSQVEAPSPEPWGFWPTLGLGAGMYAIIQVAMALGLIAFAFGRFVINSGPFTEAGFMEGLLSNGQPTGLALGVSSLPELPAAIGVVWFFAWLRKGMSVRDYLGLRWPGWRQAGGSVLIVLAVTYGFELLLDVCNIDTGGNEWMMSVARTAGSVPLLLFAIVIVAPIVEELLFRGFLLPGFSRTPLGAVGGVALTALVWAGLHIQYNVWGIGEVLLMGVLLGAVRVRTGSLIPCLAIHVINNLVAMILMMKG